MQKFIFILFLLFFCSCATPLKKVDPAQTLGDIGFKFHPPSEGDWYPVPVGQWKGHVFGKDLKNKEWQKAGATVIAAGSYGYIDLKFKNSADTLAFFKAEKIKQSSGERFESIKNDFVSKKIAKADCLSFHQVSKDKLIKDSSGESFTLILRGIICLHPTDFARYVDLEISQRIPPKMTAFDLSLEEKGFFGSLTFVAR